MTDSPPQILVPVDCSPWTPRVLDTACSMAESLKGTLHVFHVTEPAHGTHPDSLPAEEAKTFFNRYTQRLMHVPTQYDVRSGEDAVEEILKKANEIEDLFMIILSTHGQTGDLDKLMGHVPLRIIQEGNFPILLTRKNMDIPIEIKRILVPLDGSAQPATVVPIATKLAEWSGGEVELFHVIEARSNPPEEEERLTPPRYMDHSQHEWTAWEHEFVERFVQPRKQESTVPIRLYMGHGEVGDAILKFARQHHTDLIAVGWNGILDAQHAQLLVGILQESSCPLLLYHTHEEGGSAATPEEKAAQADKTAVNA